MTVEDRLGREYVFNQLEGSWVIQRAVTVVGFDPDRGWRLAGRGFEPAWVPFGMWRRLRRAGVITHPVNRPATVRELAKRALRRMR